MFGVDVHLTSDYNAYVIEINRGPGMEPHCDKDDTIRQQMLKGFIDTAHGKYNKFIIRL